ncbi:MAG: TIGR00725 family protein [candidate division Zixibacteria bacterium]|nr:TIGR00725 family protein [candidate division Zixibacteria bacterium]
MPSASRKPFIGVIGAGQCNSEITTKAFELGQEIARSGAILVCGGLGGVMRAVSKGARAEGGVTIGVIPGDSKEDANEYIDYPICTGMGQARNLVIINTADVLIAVAGQYGTLSEIGFARKSGKPVISLGSWEIDDSIVRAENAKEAVQLALQAIQG